MFETISEYVKKHFENHSHEYEQLFLENLPEIVDMASKLAKEAAKNAKHFLR